ncbi:PREDICTED: ATP-binding cassette sub-family B member 10, mitochondrial [Dufourea novaeangliae]|uniref:ATP-binding cassette sub-family B member 10, mitochondrial n=1 Tax=Dufourea novaeangliae TaxID=178035 RepID=A0A154PTS4_DUFNO|nr:PREDICTED: ATP-binding cassette sub-family B member 10, mitochondrial [Dufourea novaeangliae]KZC14834.1 ATP-binding cassette sub-family B member 10, mitochondrial [Dufourea novaeangliae]
MTLLRRFFAKNIVCQRIEYRSPPIRHRQLFYTCLTSPIRVTGKTCIFSTLRYYGTKTVQVKLSNSTVRPTTGIKKISEFESLITLAAPEKWRLIGAIAFLLISSAVTMAVPFCLGKIIDIIYTSDTESMKKNLNRLCVILFGVFVVGGVCNFGRVYLMTTTGHRVTQSLRKKLYTAILHQETAMFDKCSTGEVVGRLSGDTQLISYAITSNISNGLRSAIMSISGMSMMFYVSPTLASLGLSIVPPTVGIAIIYGRYLKKVSKDIQNGLAALNTTTEEKISNIRTVKAFAKEISEIKRYNSQLEDILKICYKESLYRGIFFGFTGFSGNAVVLSVLYYGGIMVSDAAITVGGLSSFLLYAAYVGVSLNGLSSFYVELNKALGANTRILELIQRQPAIPIQGGKILEKELSGDIEFQNVSFAYPTRQNTWVLRNFSLKIPKCMVIAIVGSSGSGKSTIASLLLRLYDPDSGCIFLDNHDLKSLDPMWVKSQISIVSQEPILFSGSIRENILYGVDDSTKHEIEDVARHAHVLQFTKNMPDGLDTMIGERGITLSGGQRQRVAIARALLKEPKILILDEATSALDAESEHYVQEALEKAVKGRTVLTIAHRLSTIKNADKIIVLNQGQVAETGTYKELINIKDGYFYKLVQHQTFT